MAVVISVSDLSKKYAYGVSKEPYFTLRDSIINLAKIPRHLAGFWGNGEKLEKNEFWAIKDINFQVEEGAILGLIGPNGAGKSTILKVLSRITTPTTGSVIMRGRVASLLEVGTGFSGELTGRENIFFNGAILGMSQKEIRSKFDEIVDFAGVEKFIDTPVKYYSSGMFARLAFSVAANLDSDILLIDEVLSVGDAEFQRKSLGKMNDITQKEKRTIIFVSHNLDSIRGLCEKTVLIEKGRIVTIGETKKVVDQYVTSKRASFKETSLSKRKIQLKNEDVKFTAISLRNTSGSTEISSGDPLRFTINYRSAFKKKIPGGRILLTINNRYLQPVIRFDSFIALDTFNERISPSGRLICETDALNLMEGKYSVELDFWVNETRTDHVEGAIEFEVAADAARFDLRQAPDYTVGSYVARCSFKQI